MVRLDLENSNAKHVKSIAYDGNWKKKHTKKRFWMKKFVEFCKRTDLHGYKYIVMENFNSVERSCWAFAVLLSIAFAVYFVVTAYRWFARNPIVTVIESTQGAIWDVPFPAVTICDLNMVSRGAAKVAASKWKLPENVTSDFVFKTLKLVPLLYSAFKAEDDEKEDLYSLQEILDLNNITIHQLFKLLSPASPCNHLIERCMWKNAIYRCEELFEPIYTLLGLCCTFNYYAVDRKKGKAVVNQFSTPRRVASCGYQTALTVLLYTNPVDYYSASVASQGVLVIIDNAYNIPDLDSPVRMVNPSTEVLIALSPERTYTTSGVKTFSPQDRQCYYSDEIRIGNFQQYSFHNCMAYQKVQQLKNICNCVPIHFPFEEHYPACNFKDLDCIESVFMAETSSDPLHLFKCLPECEHYDYPLEVALGKLTDNVYVTGLPFFDDVSLVNRSLLNVFFNDLVSTRYRRDVYLNWQNVLAAFGGLLSLMLGFTLISGFDLLLFFTVRVAYNSFISLFNEKASNKINVQEHHHKNHLLPPVYSRKKTFESNKWHYYDQRRY